jgi:hypothetical protein
MTVLPVQPNNSPDSRDTAGDGGKSGDGELFFNALFKASRQRDANVPRENNRKFQSPLFASHKSNLNFRINSLHVGRFFSFLFCHPAILVCLTQSDNENIGVPQ